MYLIRRGKKAGKKVAHIWNGEDTVCTMASTGGLNPRRYLVAANPIFISPQAEKTPLPVCQMCQVNQSKHETPTARK